MSVILDFVAGRTPPDLYETYLAPGLFFPWANRLRDMVSPNGTCIDVACGTGVVSRTLASRPDVDQVSAIDVAPPMIAKAEALVQGTASENKISYQLASADQLPFGDSVFDYGLCQQGLQFFPDKVAALREVRRVLKPGGKFAAAVWTASADGNPIFGAFEEIVERRFGSDLVPLGPFSFGDRQALQDCAEAAGFVDFEVRRESMMSDLPDARTLVLFDLLFLGRPDQDGALQPLIDPDSDESDAQVETIIADMELAVAKFAQPDGSLRAPSTTNVLLAQH